MRPRWWSRASVLVHPIQHAVALHLLIESHTAESECAGRCSALVIVAAERIFNELALIPGHAVGQGPRLLRRNRRSSVFSIRTVDRRRKAILGEVAGLAK